MGFSRKAKWRFNQSLQAWNIESEQAGYFQLYIKRDGNARKGRDVEEGERQAASGRAARSSRLLRCSSSCIHHFQNYPCVTTDTRFRGSLWRCWSSRICTFSTAHNKLNMNQPSYPPLNLNWHLHRNLRKPRAQRSTYPVTWPSRQPLDSEMNERIRNTMCLPRLRGFNKWLSEGEEHKN